MALLLLRLDLNVGIAELPHLSYLRIRREYDLEISMKTGGGCADKRPPSKSPAGEDGALSLSSHAVSDSASKTALFVVCSSCSNAFINHRKT